MCNKSPYLSRKDARAAARYLRAHGSNPGHAYKCQRCEFWHLTTMSRAQAKVDIKARKQRRRERYEHADTHD